MEEKGELLSRDQLTNYFGTFRTRFGPERLKALNGAELLETMHSHGNRDSLVYWLEFKDDGEFPAIFGSIAGGSAHKFGIYKRKENGAWAVQGEGRTPKEVPLDYAIEIAEKIEI